MMMMMMMMSTPLSPLRLFLVFFRQSLGVVVVVVVVVVPTPPSSLSLLSLSLATASTSRSEEETKRVVFRAKNNEEDVFCVLLSRSKIFPIERILPSSLLKRGGLGEKTTTRLQKRGAPPPLFVILLRGEEHKSSPREQPSRSTEEVAPFDTHRS